MSIKVLDEHLINKIAAGEVIERPASIVKELVENSLDSGATQILIEIKNYGKDLIKIKDNGKGMDKDDLKLSVLRHATSKISNEDDLFSINTLGFRGEALASIAAVSKLSITTKQKGLVEGYRLNVEGGTVLSFYETGADEGTLMEVQDVFFNTPARLKFLKTDSVEFSHIVDVVTRYALINPKIAIKLIHNDKIIINAPVTDFLNNLVNVYGTELAKEMLEVDYSEGDLRVFGWISKPTFVRNDKNQQALYINNRAIQNKTITQALYDAYHNLLFVNKHPVVVLNVDLDPSVVDVNVHPAKREVRIEKKDLVYRLVYNAIQDALNKKEMIPEVKPSVTEIDLYGEEVKPVPKVVEKKSYVSDDVQDTLDLEEDFKIFDAVPEDPLKEIEIVQERPKLPKMRILGQIHKSFFLAEVEDGFLIIDQHVVQERALYEQFMKMYFDKKIEMQALIEKVIFDLTPRDAEVMRDELSLFKELGFEIEEFGTNTFWLKSVPVVFGKVQGKRLIYDVLDSLDSSSVDEIKEDAIISKACRASVKAGDEMTVEHLKKLLNELSATSYPFACPHGRPIFVKVTSDEVERLFRRR
jgi:DNA mismatch repair protein MutL